MSISNTHIYGAGALNFMEMLGQPIQNPGGIGIGIGIGIDHPIIPIKTKGPPPSRCKTLENGKTFVFMEKWNFSRVEMGFKCGHCSKQTPTKQGLITHLERWHCTGDFKCVKCGKACSSQLVLQSHPCSPNPTPKVMSVEVAPGFFMWNDKWPFRKRSDGLFQCSTCAVTRKRRHQMTHHLREYHEYRGRFRCEICNKICVHKQALNTHRFTHPEISQSLSQSFDCGVCGKKFNSPRNLKTHENRHEKNYKHFCTICNKGFLLKGLLTKHLSSGAHSKEPGQNVITPPPNSHPPPNPAKSHSHVQKIRARF